MTKRACHKSAEDFSVADGCLIESILMDKINIQ